HDLWIGEKRDSVVYVRNLTDRSIVVHRVWIDGGDAGDFWVEPLQSDATLAPNASLPVNVRFSPTLPGFRSCIIRAETSSRQTPFVDSVLYGFGKLAMSRDILTIDTSLAYSCSSRRGRVTIYNDGNTPLTLNNFGLVTNPNIATANLPSPGY